MRRPKGVSTQDLEAARAVGLTEEDIGDVSALVSWARNGGAWSQFMAACRLIARLGNGTRAPLPAPPELTAPATKLREAASKPRQHAVTPPRDDQPASAVSLARLDEVIDHVATGAAFPAQRTRRE
jgi:hypothetical protein